MKTDRGLLALAALAWTAAVPVQAQDRNSYEEDAPSADALLDVTLSCIATYDIFLARDRGDDLAKEGRGAAVDLYAELSGENDDDIAAEVRQADADLPQWLAEGGDTLEDMRAGCDEAFMDNTGGDDETPSQAI